MKGYKKVLGVITVFVAMLTLGGLGNIAIKEPIYWVPFVLDIPFFTVVAAKLFKEDK